MKHFQIFKHPTLGHEAVKEGWSWPGFVFCGFWALVKRLWIVGAVIWSVAFISSGLSDTLAGFLLIPMAIVVGVMGNEWRTKELLSRGYEPVGRMEAGTPDGALAAFLAKRGDAVTGLRKD